MLANAANPDANPDVWASWRWLTTPDERVLWAMVAAAAAMLVWGGALAWLRRFG